MFEHFIFNPIRVFELMLRFGVHQIILFVLIRLIYFPLNKNKNYLFLFTLIGNLIFLLCYALGDLEIKLGFAFGLFAIFGIMRFRTESIPVREMTYLFVIIGLSLVNSLPQTKIMYLDLIFTNLIILLLTFGLERTWLINHENSRLIVYKNIEQTKPENRNALLEELSEKTGLKIHRVEIGKMDFDKNTSWLEIYYFEK